MIKKEKKKRQRERGPSNAHEVLNAHSLGSTVACLVSAQPEVTTVTKYLRTFLKILSAPAARVSFNAWPNATACPRSQRKSRWKV